MPRGGRMKAQYEPQAIRAVRNLSFRDGRTGMVRP
jgi:hypothetical protein